MLIKNKFPEKIFRIKSVNVEFSRTDCGARQISYFSHRDLGKSVGLCQQHSQGHPLGRCG